MDKQAQHISEHQGAKYLIEVVSSIDGSKANVDVYDVIEAFKKKFQAPNCQAVQHALKKLLCGGSRGKGNILEDLWGAHAALQRAIQLEETRTKAAGETLPPIDWKSPPIAHYVPLVKRHLGENIQDQVEDGYEKRELLG